MTTVTNEDYWLHVVRNPWGHSEDRVRAARLNLCDAFEKLQREFKAERDVSHKLIEALKQAITELEDATAVRCEDYRGVIAEAEASRARTFGGES